MSFLDDNIVEQRVDVSKLLTSESPFLSLDEANMYFTFQFNIDGNYSYCLMMIRGLLLNMLDVLSCNTQVRRVTVGEIHVPEKWKSETARIFYDRETFPYPTSNCPLSEMWYFDIYLDVEEHFTIPEALRIMCPMCQLLRILSQRNYVYTRSAKLLRNDAHIIGSYDFENYIEYYSSLKTRYHRIDDVKLTGMLNYIHKMLTMFNIKIDFSDTDYYNNQIANYLGHLKG